VARPDAKGPLRWETTTLPLLSADPTTKKDGGERGTAATDAAMTVTAAADAGATPGDGTAGEDLRAATVATGAAGSAGAGAGEAAVAMARLEI
jgi:hypothetical protein